MNNITYLICFFIFLIMSLIALFTKFQLVFHLFIPVAIYCIIKLIFKSGNIIFTNFAFYAFLFCIVMALSVPHVFYLIATRLNFLPEFFRMLVRLCKYYSLDVKQIIASLTVFFILILADGYISKNFDSKKIIASLILCVIFSMLTILFFDNEIAIIRYDFKSDKIQNQIKIAHVSDTHSNEYLINNLYKIIESENVDLILLTGDIFDDFSEFDPTRELMKEIVKVAPVYYVPGNHEIREVGTFEKIAEMESIGVNYLGDDFLNVKVKNSEIIIAGIIDPELEEVYTENKDFDDRFEILKDGVNEDNGDKLKILLSHRPEKIDLYKNSAFDFVLSGHAHGGQVRIPFLINGVIAPNQGFFPKYAGGNYKLNEETTLIVNRGLKITGVPRIMNPPELVIITID